MYRLAFRTEKGFKLGLIEYERLEDAQERMSMFKEEFNNSGVCIIYETFEELIIISE